MLLPTLLNRQRQVGIKQVEIDARPAGLLQRWVQLFHATTIGGIPSHAKPDFPRIDPLAALPGWRSASYDAALLLDQQRVRGIGYAATTAVESNRFMGCCGEVFPHTLPGRPRGVNGRSKRCEKRRRRPPG
jgi:hypothetical protein